MRKDYRKYKNISLSVIIKRDLEYLKMTQKKLSLQIDMSYGHFNRLLNTTCKFPASAERRIEEILGYELFFLRNLRELQMQSKLADEKNRIKYATKEIPSIRRCVFWDIDSNNLDWSKHQKFIIRRILRYGNDQEKKSVMSFYNS